MRTGQGIRTVFAGGMVLLLSLNSGWVSAEDPKEGAGDVQERSVLPPPLPPTEAQSGNGPYFHTPAWDWTLPSSTRFLILLNFASMAVLDHETGLVWERIPAQTEVTWGTARSQCVNRTIGGRKGWRLPSVSELTSLIDPTVAAPGPTLQAGHPFVVQSARYWSASTTTDAPTFAWFVNFSNGSEFNFSKTGTCHAWCVRGGMNADAY